MQTVENKVEIFIKQKNLLPAGEKVLLAVSGGADSVALLCILSKINPANLHIAHINHQLRGSESLKDEYYVKLLAEKYKLPVTVELADVNTYAKNKKLSIETAARELRLAALVRIADKNNCKAIVTAHHKNDNAETVIQRILRGTGYKGLAGIRPKNVINEKTFIRPLLCLSRTEIEEYLKTQNIAWQNDHTNMDCRFTRNRIRHKLLPYLLKESPNIIELISDLSNRCENLSDNIEKYCNAAEKECFISKDNEQIIIDLSKFSNLPNPVQVELIQKALTLLKCGLREYTFDHYMRIINFITTAQTGKNLTVPGKIKIAKGYDNFFIGTSKINRKVEQVSVLNVPGKTVFENFTIETAILENINFENITNKSNFIELFNFAQIKFPLYARHRKQGDRFRPFGQNKFKKIGKFLTSEKIDIAQRNKIFVIEDAEKILWFAPIRRSSEAIVDSNSHKVLKIIAIQTV